jgi:hypothetical protein
MLGAEDGDMRCLAFGLCIALLPAAAPPRPDFSGTWDMDASRSESAHQDVPIGPVSLVIRQTAAEITIETRRSGDPPETLVFRLDGTEKKNIGSGVVINAKSRWDGPKLVMETEREINGATVTTMQVFTMEAGGKEIVVRKTLTVQHGYQSPGAPKTTGAGTDTFVRATKK